jgi:undecaprenyl-diphosphatase
MTIFQSILLGIVQGLTEFLPVSSSGHLVIVPYLLGWDIPADVEFVFDVLVQVATLVAVIVYFWNDLLQIARAFVKNLASRTLMQDPDSRLGVYIILATIPAGVIGILVKDLIEQSFDSPVATALFLWVTAALLVIAERVGKRTKDLIHLNWKDAIWIGFFQALAVFSGISRSGSTITGAMVRDYKREPAARFSFLIMVPIMLAAGLLATLDLFALPDVSGNLLVFLPGFIAAGVTGYIAIRWLLRYLTRHPLYIFAWYCAAIGLLTLVVSFIRG